MEKERWKRWTQDLNPHKQTFQYIHSLFLFPLNFSLTL